MKEYLSLLEEVLEQGIRKNDRTNVGTISKFGTQRRYDLTKGFPLATTKKVHFKSIVYELLWFIKGDTNIKYLVDNDVRIWNEWPYKKFQQSSDFKDETIDEFIDKIKKNKRFAKKYGDLGPIYGAQWRNFNGVDQLSNIINEININPDSRRLILSSWNPPKINNMALPPCHTLVQFYVNNGKLSCHLYQRSADLFLGVPFNIASYSLLTILIAQVTRLEPSEFIHTTGDTHIYLNHLAQVHKQLARQPKKLPKLKINPWIRDITKFSFEDIELVDYDPHPLLKGKVAI